MKITAFPPYYNESSVLLILGSFPSVKSREDGFFYGNNQNRFWKGLASALNAPLPFTIEQKKALLTKNQIALWDIVTACDIVGSSDSSIKNAEIADVYLVLKKSNIKAILLNGLTAQKLFLKYYPELKEISRLLPSTSPRNAHYSESIFIQSVQDALKR